MSKICFKLIALLVMSNINSYGIWEFVLNYTRYDSLINTNMYNNELLNITINSEIMRRVRVRLNKRKKRWY